jgi:hypothetical protein
MRRWLVVLALAWPGWTAAEEMPRFGTVRLDDVYPSRERATTFSDRLKRYPLPLPESFLSLGGEVRLRYDYRDDEEWGEAPQDDAGAFLQRYLLYANLELGPWIRVFGELRSALEDGREAPPSPVEEGRIDLQQAVIELRTPRTSGPVSAFLRGGRQEMRFGSQRLVAVREGPNIRRRFDGLRATVRSQVLELTAVAATLTENETGDFSDGTNEDVAFWGLYGVADAPFGLPTGLDLYYLGYREKDARFVQGEARELRHSVGLRVHGARGPFDWNWEGIVQWGSFGGADILAWTVASDTGFRFEQLPFTPRLGLSANVASGDDDPNDDELGTFNPLFPRGNYFSHLALLGPRNFANLHPSLELRLSDALSFTVDANFYWRLEANDGLYGPSGKILREGSTTNSHFVGPAISGSLDWTVNRFLFVGLIYTRGFAGPFIEDTGASRDIDFVELTLQARF